MEKTEKGKGAVQGKAEGVRPLTGVRLVSSLEARAKAETELGLLRAKREDAPELAEKALERARRIGEEGGAVLFHCADEQLGRGVEEAARLCGMPWAVGRWRAGQLSDLEGSKEAFAALEEIERRLSARALPRAEALSLGRRKEQLERKLEGSARLEGKPRALFAVGIRMSEEALREARLCGVETIALGGEDSRWSLADWPVPGAERSAAEVARVAREIAQALLEGRERAREAARGARKAG